MPKRFVSGLIMLAVCLSLFACGPSQAELDSQATQVVEDYYATQTAAPTATTTPTPIPTATPEPTATPTPIPGKFISPPEYLETVFYPDWGWMTNANNLRVGTSFKFKGGFIPLLTYRGNNGISFGALFLETAPNESQLFNDFISSVLIYYVSTAAQEQILMFTEANTEIGKYETTIESFAVTYEVRLDKGDRVLQITIYQT